FEVFQNDNNNGLRLMAVLQVGSRPERRAGVMRRKPDLIWILVLIFTLGVVTTGYTQSYLERSESPITQLPATEGSADRWRSRPVARPTARPEAGRPSGKDTLAPADAGQASVRGSGGRRTGGRSSRRPCPGDCPGHRSRPVA